MSTGLPVIVIIGPTGSGKTALSYALSAQLTSCYIINGDMGQCYQPLTIGTAKPPLINCPLKHYLFDLLAEPVSYSSYNFRRDVVSLIKALDNTNCYGIVVGGSTLYMYSLFFNKPSCDAASNNNSIAIEPTWQNLAAIDPVRASQLHKHDTYRIARALEQWQTTGVLPSVHKPVFDPIGPIILIHLTYNRTSFKQSLRQRIVAMLTNGWLQEVQALIGTPWQEFWQTKKIIGYSAVATFIAQGHTLADHQAVTLLVEQILQETTAYAKKQEKYWRMLVRHIQAHDPDKKYVDYYSVDLTLLSGSLYLEQVRIITDSIQRRNKV